MRYSKEWSYADAAIKIHILIFYLHKINLWKKWKENQYLVYGFFLASWCTGLIVHACLLHPTEGDQEGTLTSRWILLLPINCHSICTKLPKIGKQLNWKRDHRFFRRKTDHVTLTAVLLITVFQLIKIAMATDRSSLSQVYFHQRNVSISGVGSPVRTLEGFHSHSGWRS